MKNFEDFWEREHCKPLVSGAIDPYLNFFVELGSVYHALGRLRDPT